MKNMVREKLLAGEPTLGTFFETGSATVAECLGLAGLDYIIIDTEHGPFNPQSALEFVRAAKLYGLTPFARVQEISRAAILKLLDVGVMGLVIPDVRTVAEVEKIVEYGKYLPLGKRGVANTAGSGFWFEDYAQHGLEHYFEVSNRETMLLPQCETVECLEHLEEIVRVPGIDGISVGPFDLSTALGILLGDPDAGAEFQRIYAAERETFDQQEKIDDHCVSTAHEYFAEAYRHYVLYPDILRQSAPQTYAYFQALFSEIS